MTARKNIPKFEMNFGGVDSYNQRHTMVVVGCKIELVCKIPIWV
jgi:hypothetical protein